MSRPDHAEFLAGTTFGFIPAGSGNGLVHSILGQAEETGDEVLAMTYLIMKGQRFMMDMTEL